MGSYRRAMDKLTTDIQRSDLDITEKCRILNDRIMSVSGRGSLSLNLYLIITLPYFDFLLHISAYLLNCFFFLQSAKIDKRLRSRNNFSDHNNPFSVFMLRVCAGGAPLPVSLRVSQRPALPPYPTRQRAPHADCVVRAPGTPAYQRPQSGHRLIPRTV